MGWGQVGQHRKHGQKGGRKVGRHKGSWTYVIKYEPNYFGKKGFTSIQALHKQIHAINIGQLDQLIHKLTHEKTIQKKKGKTYIDLTQHGYQKLLATGKLTKPLIIKVDSYSQNAAKKIKEAGGQIISKPQEKTQEIPQQPEKTAEEPPKT